MINSASLNGSARSPTYSISSLLLIVIVVVIIIVVIVVVAALHRYVHFLGLILANQALVN